ncbi:thioesterase II family protein [Streptomyces capitiformicae]|uniref:Thioesterase n=1 Tax=Streptomyces capitiformicae TaxID=2014920 RepID=A0A918ZKC8_9ACTN|nr:alpha/beta fold hydrolase [Streptomyces capitiformicae]GHE57466.1 thioesterase [Streptomyces capitiformicae]
MNRTWFRRFGPALEGGIRLVCFPHAGASATAYLGLSRSLADSRGLDVLAVQYPGRQDRRQEQPLRTIDELARSIADEFAPFTDRPYSFFGHSMGAVVAYETTRRLLERRLPGPERLFLSGRGAPGPRPSAHDRLDSDAEILAAVRRLGGTGSALLDDPELLDMVLPALRADYGALARYTTDAAEPLPVPLTALVGDADPVVPVDTATAWRARTSRDFALNVFTGGHFYLDAHPAEVAAVIASSLLTGSTP